MSPNPRVVIISRVPGPLPGTQIVTYDINGVDRGQITLAVALENTVAETNIIVQQVMDHIEATAVLKENPL